MTQDDERAKPYTREVDASEQLEDLSPRVRHALDILTTEIRRQERRRQLVAKPKPVNAKLQLVRKSSA